MNRVSGTGRWKSRALWAAVGVAAAATSPSALADGSVTVDTTGGTLTITGDDAANSLDIFISGNAMYISPTSNTGLSGPSVVPLASVTNIVLRLGGGNDYVSAYGANITGDITVDAGAGNDVVLLNGFGSAKLTFTSGDGDDTVSIVGCVISGDVAFDPGAGGGLSNIQASTIGGSLTVDARQATVASPEVNLTSLTVAGATSVLAGNTVGLSVLQTGGTYTGRFSFRGGSQADGLTTTGTTFESGFDVRGGTGDDTLQVFCQSTGIASSIKGDAGNDRIEWSATATDSRRTPRVNITLNAGAGNDIVRAVGSSVVASGTVKVITGGGNDEVEVANLSAPSLSVTQGGGTDTCSIYRLNITGKSSFNGGGARDVIRGSADAGHTFGKKPRVAAYESKVALDT